MKYIVLTLCLFLSNNILSQKVLQIEKYGKAKTKKIYLGEQLTFQLKGSKDWYSEILVDLKTEEQILVFTNRYVKVGDIVALKTFKTAGMAKNLQYSLYSFAVSWAFYSLGARLFFDEPLTEAAAVVPATSIALGWSIRKLFSYKKIRIGKRKRLRALDIGFNNQMIYDFKN